MAALQLQLQLHPPLFTQTTTTTKTSNNNLAFTTTSRNCNCCNNCMDLIYPSSRSPSPPIRSTTTNKTSRRGLLVVPMVAFNPQANFDDLPPFHDRPAYNTNGDGDGDGDGGGAPTPLPPKEGRVEVVLHTSHIRSLDLSPFHSSTHHLLSSPRGESISEEVGEEYMERTIGFSINYEREDPCDQRELSEIPDIRLWFVRLDAAYPWLPIFLDWRAGELARYAAMLVPHQMSMRMGVVFNPEALELFIMKKVFIVYPWLKHHHNFPTAKARLKTNDMARMLGFGISDQLFDFIDHHPTPYSDPPQHLPN